MTGFIVLIVAFLFCVFFEEWWKMKKAVALFLDDERDPPRAGGPWVVVRTAPAAIKELSRRNFKTVSLDHDLGPADAGTGYDVMLWLEERAARGLPVPGDIRLHTMNPVARQRMDAALEAIQRHKALRVSEFFVDRHGKGE